MSEEKGRGRWEAGRIGGGGDGRREALSSVSLLGLLQGQQRGGKTQRRAE